MRRFTSLAAACLGLSFGLGGPVLAVAQPAPRASAPTSAKIDGRAAIVEIRRVLAANYVVPDVRAKLDVGLAKGLAAGRYDISDPNLLVDRINADMKAVTPDKHLNISYDPRAAAQLATDRARAGPADDDAPTAADIRRAVARNHGIPELKLLPGNIRYVEVDGFMWAGPQSAEAYATAARFLRDGDAVIIDLRRNGGGSPEAVQYLISHFLAPNRPLVTFHMGATQVDKLATLPTLSAGRMVGKPLYLLISGRTGSAAEEFAGHVAGYKLGELIGESTAGAGFRNEFFPIPGGFMLSVSVGRAVLASTGGDWEGKGIAPTTKVPVEQALEVAQVHALRRLAGSASGRDKAILKARAAVIDAQLNPVTPALPLSAYAGTFGERAITLDGGRLIFQRTGGPKLVMIATGPNRFTFEADPLTTVDFNVSGSAATGFTMQRSDGSVVTAARSG